MSFGPALASGNSTIFKPYINFVELTYITINETAHDESMARV
ncbi:hypothetical protein HPTD01_2244 [Halomonas sp. TD01]|nr:hypothetical protein HPTD01_2244 [Halomonas sp. TD01]